jgi:hypothetical protein
MKFPANLCAALGLCLSAMLAPAANILWVSDQVPANPAGNAATSDNNATPGAAVFTSGAGPYPDAGLVSLLTGSGHTVTRMNPSDTAALTAAELNTINTGYNLVIIGRSISSNAFNSAALAAAWNTGVTIPLLSTNTFASRRGRLGWFTNAAGTGELGGVLTSAVTFANPADPVASYLIGATAMTGATTTNSLYEAVPGLTGDRGENFVDGTHTVITGGTAIARGSNNGHAIATFPAGSTAVALGTTNQTLGGYRVFFAAGNQEAAASPGNGIGNAGYDNLTAEGEQMFLRAVTLALNNGVIPEPGSVILGLTGLSLILRRRTRLR